MNCVTEVYDAELERLNASMLAENQTLMNDNKQLNALIKEYEQTLENVMAQFRNRAVRLITANTHAPSLIVPNDFHRTKFNKENSR